MRLVLLCVVLFVITDVWGQHRNWAADTEIILEHRFGTSGAWSERGTLSYRSAANTPLSSSKYLEKLEINQNHLSESQKQELKVLYSSM